MIITITFIKKNISLIYLTKLYIMSQIKINFIFRIKIYF